MKEIFPLDVVIRFVVKCQCDNKRVDITIPELIESGFPICPECEDQETEMTQVFIREPAQEFIFHADPGHAWLEVPIKTLQEYGIADKISNYSYMSGNLAYLEEDCDAHLFLQEVEQRGIKYKIIEKHTNGTSFVRSCKYYK